MSTGQFRNETNEICLHTNNIQDDQLYVSLGYPKSKYPISLDK